MIRKFLTTLLALLLAVMVPVCAMADRQHTLTFIPGPDLASIEAVADLAQVLSLTLTKGDEGGALGIGLSGQEMLNIAASADEAGLYLRSNLTGDEVLYLDWADGIALFTELAAAEMGEEEALALKQALEAQLGEIAAASVNPMATLTTSEEAIKAVEKAYPNDPEMVEYTKKIYEEIAIEEGSFASEKRDTATGKMAMNLTDEDLLALCDTQTMRNMMAEIVKTENPELEAAELEAATEALLDEVREIYANMEMDMGMSIYTVDDAETIVGLDLSAPMTIKDGEETIHFVMNLEYNRLTADNGVSYKANLEMGVPEETDGMITVVFDHFKGADERYTSHGFLALLVAGQQLTITYDATTEDFVRTRLAGVYLRDGAAAVIEPAAAERPLISFQVVSQNADSDMVKAVESATADTAVNVLQLSEEGLNELINNFYVHFTQVYANALANLPESILALMIDMGE